MKCPLCDFESVSNECQCGYKFIEATFDEDKVARYYAFLKENRSLREEIAFIERIHEFQSNRYRLPPGKRKGWTQEKTAKLLKTHKSIVCDSLKLSASPELLDTCPNRATAFRIQANSILQILLGGFQTEEELHLYLEKNWDHTPYGSDWELRYSHFNAKSCGEIDLVAKHRFKQVWLIVELKRIKTSDNTVGQLLRYMGWFKQHCLSGDEDIQGLIISGYPPDTKVNYALEYARNVAQDFYSYKDDKFRIIDSSTAYKLYALENSPDFERDFEKAIAK